MAIANPLACQRNLMKDTVGAAYVHALGSFEPPTLRGVCDAVLPHFHEDVQFNAAIMDDYEGLGVCGADDLRLTVESGFYDRFAPDKESVQTFLNMAGLTYVDDQGHVVNSSVVRVW